jgi:predicted CopG family antitoxin
MDISLQSLFYFIIITIIYFSFPAIGKPQLTLEYLEKDKQMDYYNTNIKRLALYFGVVVVSQMFLNVGYLMSKCGGSLDKNISAAAMYTIIPWILIFGILMIVLLIFPGFKSAFSDVIGYYIVSREANDIFGSILIGTDLNEEIEKTNDPDKKNELTKAAEAIIKICGNKSIIINQMNPDNFSSVWDALKPLMKPGSFDDISIKQRLLDIVAYKENIGEAFWYIYASILISSIVYYNLATRGCVKSLEEIKSDHDAYVKSQEEQIEKTKATATTYKIG